MKPIGVATDGYLCGNTLSIVSNGYLCTIKIELIVNTKFGGGLKARHSKTIGAKQRWDKKDKWLNGDENKLAKITVTCVIDGNTYVKTKTTNDINIKVKDINVIINEKKQIKIEILKS